MEKSPTPNPPSSSTPTISSQDVLEKEFLAYLLFSSDTETKDHTTEEAPEAWRNLVDSERAKYRVRAEEMLITGRSMISGYACAPHKKLVSTLRSIITVPAAEAYPLLEGVKEE
jgi:hypothetical protein